METKAFKVEDLDETQLEFLAKHKIQLDEVLDATGLKTSEYKAIMAKSGFKVAIGVTPCKKFGHQMRAANGHCVMCKPANLGYRKRYRESGFVYIAKTKEQANLIKVGYCNELKAREKSLNVDGYGGFGNWYIVYSRAVNEKGEVEHYIHKRLSDYAVVKQYIHENKEQTATELFLCHPSQAISLLKLYKPSSNETGQDGSESKTTSHNRSKPGLVIRPLEKKEKLAVSNQKTKYQNQAPNQRQNEGQEENDEKVASQARNSFKIPALASAFFFLSPAYFALFQVLTSDHLDTKFKVGLSLLSVVFVYLHTFFRGEYDESTFFGKIVEVLETPISLLTGSLLIIFLSIFPFFLIFYLVSLLW